MITADVRQAWEKAWDYLKDKLGNPTFETWILPLRPKLKDEHTCSGGAG